MTRDGNGPQQASNKARCGRLALSMQAEQEAAPQAIQADEPLNEVDAPVSRRPQRLSTSERLRRLEEFSAA